MKRFLALTLVLLVALLAGMFAIGWYQDNRMSNFEGTARIYVREDTSVDDVIGQIGKQTTIRNVKRLRRVFEQKEVARYLTPGFYQIGKSNTSVYVARMLNNGWQSPVNLTMSGSMRRNSDIAHRIASQMMADSAALMKVMKDEKFLAAYGVTPRTVFSLIIPDTYEMYWTASPEEIFARFKQEYDKFWTEENVAKARKLNLSKQQVSILASIVRAESNYAPELPKIAGVYLNRLKTGMLLQADPTVAFCYDYKPNRILKRHLEVDSRYNTYKYPGLPPGPICVPAKECLEAVLNPDFGGSYGAGGNLYFCANPDFSGTHVFAKTLSAHNANAAAFQAELNRRNIKK